jgi:hypothetical protein
VNEEVCPYEHPHEVLYSVWLGLHQHCDCYNADRNANVDAIHVELGCPTTRTTGRKESTMTVPGCKFIDPMPPVIMSDLGGYRVCGATDSTPFKDAVRVNSDRECTKSGYVACNPEASVENILCVEDLSQCGITDIKIFEFTRDATRFLQENRDKGYEEVDSDKRDLLMYVSKKTDNLPLTSIKLHQSQPCLDPTY